MRLSDKAPDRHLFDVSVKPTCFYLSRFLFHFFNIFQNHNYILFECILVLDIINFTSDWFVLCCCAYMIVHYSVHCVFMILFTLCTPHHIQCSFILNVIIIIRSILFCYAFIPYSLHNCFTSSSVDEFKTFQTKPTVTK